MFFSILAGYFPRHRYWNIGYKFRCAFANSFYFLLFLFEHRSFVRSFWHCTGANPKVMMALPDVYSSIVSDFDHVENNGDQ